VAGAVMLAGAAVAYAGLAVAAFMFGVRRYRRG
jgi:hypothetical protein